MSDLNFYWRMGDYALQAAICRGNTIEKILEREKRNGNISA